MWMANLKKISHVLKLLYSNKRKGIHSSISEKLATMLGDLHLIPVYYRLHHPHA